MKRLFIIAAFALSGCSGTNTAPTPLTPAAFPARNVPHAEAKGRVFYVSDYGSNVLYVFSYETGKEIGSTTKGISGPQGLCASTTGEAYLANTNDSNILGFKDGSTTSNIALSDSGEYPAGCAVDKKGDVAVANICSAPSCTGGDVTVFKGGTGTPTAYTCPNLNRYYFIAYDGNGNLFVDGENGSYSFALCEVPKGSAKAEAITLSTIPQFPGDIQWDGKYLAIQDQSSGATIYRFAIHGTTGMLKGTVTGVGGSPFIMDGKRKVVGMEVGGSGAIYFWHYPKGGDPYKTLQIGGLSEAIGLAISPAPKV